MKKNIIRIAFVIGLGGLVFSSCTDLDETYYDKLAPEKVHLDVDDPVDAIYTALRGSGAVQPYYYPGSEYVWFTELSTDEVCIPIRKGGDWKDNYDYQKLQFHTWDANDNSGNGNRAILASWNYAYGIIGACNVELRRKESYSDNQIAQIRLVRAYAYMMLLDRFGNVPIVLEDNEGAMPASSKRIDVYNFVRDELNDPIMENLRTRRVYTSWNKNIRHALQARLYLNSKVYTGCSDEDYKMNLDTCVAVCDSIINTGKYSVASNYFSSFYVDNEIPANGKEIIAAIPYDVKNMGTTGNYLPMLTLAKMSDLVFGIDVLSNCVNGPCVNPGMSKEDTEATFNIFDKKDIRRLSMLAGCEKDGKKQPMVNKETGAPIIVTVDTIYYNPYFTGGFSEWKTVKDNPNAALRGDGARLMKYEIDESTAWEMDNDLVLIRYSEILYTKAEALIRIGRATEAIPLFEEVLAHRGYNGQDLSDGLTIDDYRSKRNISTNALEISIDPTLDFMEKELRREFIFEGHRRTDMIRFGSYFKTWGQHTIPSEQVKALFPIPNKIRETQPNVKQNPGYDGYDGWLD